MLSENKLNESLKLRATGEIISPNHQLVGITNLLTVIILQQIGEKIINVVGNENITGITHCATRIRIEVKDREAIDDKKIDQVKGVFFNAGQYQIIL